MSNNDGFLALLPTLIKKLPKRDALLLIYLIALTLLFGYSIQTLGNVINKIPDPYNKIFLVPALALLLPIVVACFKITSKLISKHKDMDEDDDIAITKLGTFNQSTLNNLINQFELSHTQAKRLSTRMRLWKSGGYFELQDKLDLANWCKIADDKRKQAREIARKISILVFGKDISQK